MILLIILLDVVGMPHCCVSQGLPCISVLTGDWEPTVLGLQLYWGPYIKQQCLGALAEPLLVLSVLCGQCTGWLLLSFPLHLTYFPLLIRDG